MDSGISTGPSPVSIGKASGGVVVVLSTCSATATVVSVMRSGVDGPRSGGGGGGSGSTGI